MNTPLRRLSRLVAAGGAVVLSGSVLAACSAEDASDADIDVVASFYPLQFAAERVGGEHVAVQNLTPAGADSHDLELDPRQVAELADADVVLYLSGFQPAVDAVVEQQAADTALDAADVLESSDHDHDDDHDHGDDDHDHGDEDHDHGDDDHDHGDEDHDHGDDDHGDEDHGHGDEGHDDHDHDHGDVDPHLWLDPILMAEIVDAVAESFAAADADNAQSYRDAGATLHDELHDLDEDFEAGLQQCDSRDLVTSHAAFGYLAQRYDLEQIAVSGLSPEAEPSPEAIREVADYVDEHDVSTVFYETLVDPGVAESVAAETGAETAVLDPLEGLTADAEGDYLSIMGENLEALRVGLRCE